MEERDYEERNKGVADDAYKVAMLAGKTAAGLGLGIATGVGLFLAAGVAEVAIPAILTYKAFGLLGGALGFMQGAKELK